ncbi:MAG: alpha/beta hydrolase, partial [Candidatus Izemoplasmataceae bacterium]
VYSGNFSRHNRPEDDTHAYLRVSDVSSYPRETLTFKSGDNALKGYLYHQENAHALIVIVHGLGGGADSYLAHMKWFFDEGFSVFMFDATGSYDSEGDSTMGFPQILIDLDYALDEIKSMDEVSELDLLLFGHSWGGYAALNSPHLSEDVSAIVSVSAPSNAFDMINEQVKSTLGIYAYVQSPYLNIYQRYRFNKYASLDGIDAINTHNVPTFLIHGSHDEMVDITGSAAIARIDEINISLFDYLIIEEAGKNNHNHLLKSDAAITYIESINQDYKTIYDTYNGQIPTEIKSAFYQSVDRELVQELDETLMQAIKAFYLNALTN